MFDLGRVDGDMGFTLDAPDVEKLAGGQGGRCDPRRDDVVIQVCPPDRSRAAGIAARVFEGHQSETLSSAVIRLPAPRCQEPCPSVRDSTP